MKEAIQKAHDEFNDLSTGRKTLTLLATACALATIIYMALVAATSMELNMLIIMAVAALAIIPNGTHSIAMALRHGPAQRLHTLSRESSPIILISAMIIVETTEETNWNLVLAMVMAAILMTGASMLLKDGKTDPEKEEGGTGEREK